MGEGGKTQVKSCLFIHPISNFMVNPVNYIIDSLYQFTKCLLMKSHPFDRKLSLIRWSMQFLVSKHSLYVYTNKWSKVITFFWESWPLPHEKKSCTHTPLTVCELESLVTKMSRNIKKNFNSKRTLHLVGQSFSYKPTPEVNYRISRSV